MKKVLLFAAAASVAFTSCVKNEPAPEIGASDSKITFEAPAVSGITRAALVPGEIVSPYSKAEHFSVYALYFPNNYTAFADGTAFMTNEETAYNAANGTKGGWDTETAGGQAYYWPKNGTLTFAAYSPSGADDDCTVNWDAQGFTFENFTVQQNPAQHYDLMFSERSYDRQASTGGTTYDGVDINFKHALSSIVFQVKKMEEYAGHTITVTDITLKNAYETGTFKQGLADNGTATTTAAAWSGQTSENAGYSVLTANEIVASTAATKLVNVTPLIILPQATAHGTNNIMIDVKYKIHNGTGEIEQSATIDIADGTYNITEFELGKRYIFTLNFGLNKIYFSPEVEVWEDVTVTPDINL